MFETLSGRRRSRPALTFSLAAHALFAGLLTVPPLLATQEPPELGKPYPILVPQVDSDGNDLAGIRMPEIQAPLATYTGWNLRSKEIGAPDQLFALVGSFIPFARTKAERMKSGDPRLSIEERYSGKEDYLAKFEQVAKSLASQRYLLASDVPSLVQRGGAEWDLVHQ